MNPEDAIDRVLAGLAHVEASPALERRVLETIEHRAENRQTTTPRRVLFRPWAIAAGVVALAIAGSLAVRKRQEPRHEEAVLKQYTSPVSAPPVEMAPRPDIKPLEISMSASSRKTDTARPEPVSEEEALAMEEMNAPSRPAPPLPLTHQEMLLAEAAQPDSAIEPSSLRPEIRDQQMEVSKAEFHNFFEPPPAKENE